MSNKLTMDYLNTLKALPLDIKIEKTKIRIREWYEHFNGDVFVSFSGGKDSTVLLDIARNLYPNIEATFSDTGLEYPEIKEFVKTFSNVTIVKPKYSFKQILTKYGYPIISKEVANVVYNARRWMTQSLSEKECQTAMSKDYLDYKSLLNPTWGGADREWRRIRGLGEFANTPISDAKILGLLDKQNNVRECVEGEKSTHSQERWQFLLDSDFRISNKCCYHMKKSPLKRWAKENSKHPIVATMTEESNIRKFAWLRTGCNAFKGNNMASKPMSFWTEQDILQYINTKGLKIASIYGDLLHDNEKYYLTGCKRTGCVFCGFGCHLESEPNRFQILKETHPSLYNYCMNGGEHDKDGWWQPNNEGLGMKRVMDFIGVATS